MIRFNRALETWGTPTFREAIKQEIEQLDNRLLPLQQALSHGSHALETQHKAVLMGATDLGERLRVKVGVFFASVIAGCNCADDPTPMEEETEYCVLAFDIDKATAEATVELLDEETE